MNPLQTTGDVHPAQKKFLATLRHSVQSVLISLLLGALLLSCDAFKSQAETAARVDLTNDKGSAGNMIQDGSAAEAVEIKSVSNWPQWRGPNRDGISGETGLVKNWEENTPRVVWRVPIGEGFSAISISDGYLYTMYAENSDEFAACIEAPSGKEVWRFRTGANFPDHSGGNGPRSTPLIDDGLVYVFGAYGGFYALDAQNGRKIWGYDLQKAFGARAPQWGFSSSPLAEGEMVLVTAGGGQGNALIALNKKSGELIWKSQSDIAGYSSPIAVTADGVRQAIFFTGTQIMSVSPRDGKLFWKESWKTSYDVNAATPVFIPPDKIFISSEYDVGAAVFKLRASNGSVSAEKLWRSRVMKNKMASSILFRNYLYGFDSRNLKCIDALSGEEQWKQRGFGEGSLLYADGHLIVLSDRGTLVLVEATPEKYHEISSAKVLEGRCWTVPSLAGGMLYLRNMHEMLALNLKK